MQLYSAINEYIEKEMMPCGPSMDEKESFIFYIKIGIAKRKTQSIVKKFLASKGIKFIELVDDEGFIDIETIYQSTVDAMSMVKKVEICGFTFRENDLQKLYGIMQKYA